MANRISSVFDFKSSGLPKVKADIAGVDGAFNKMRTGFKSAAGEFRRSNAAQGVAIAGIGAVVGKSIAAASDLEESINAVTVSYGDNAEAVLALGENSATSFGMAKTEFNAFAVQFSSFAKTIAEREGRDVADVLGDLTQRTADFASVMNLDLNTAAQVFMSTMAGETEPIRRYGKDVSAAAVEQYALANGLIETKAELTEAVKVQARYGLLMSQTADTAGDFANTSDSLANSQRILAAETTDAAAALGEDLAPALATVVTGLTEMVDMAGPVLEFIGDIDENSQRLGQWIGDTLDIGGTGEQRRAWRENVKNFEDAEAAARSFDMAALETVTSMRDARTVAMQYADAQGGVGDAYLFANQVALRWDKTIGNQLRTQRKAEQAVMSGTDAYQELADITDLASDATDRKAEADRLAEEAARRHRQEIRYFKDEVAALKREIDDEQAMIRLEEHFANIAADADLSRSKILDLKLEALEYMDEVQNLPDAVVTDIVALIDEGKYEEAWERINRFGNGITLPIQPVVLPLPGGGGIRVDEHGNVRNVESVGSVNTENFAGAAPNVTVNVDATGATDPVAVGHRTAEALEAFFSMGGQLPPTLERRLS